MSRERFYTTKGDDGTTGLYFGGRVRKDADAPEAYGAVDEAQAFLGLARAETERGGELDQLLLQVERDLYVLMAELATAPENRSKLTAGATSVTPAMLVEIERATDDLSARFTMPSEFVLPGETAPERAPRSGADRGPPSRAAVAVRRRAGLVRHPLPQSAVEPAVGDGPLAGGAGRSGEGELMPIQFTTAREVPADADVLVVPVLAGPVVPVGGPAELDLPFLASRDFEGKLGQTQPLLADDGSTILAVGLGAADAIDLDTLRRAGAAAVKASWKARAVAVALLDAVPSTIDRAKAAQALAEGMVLGGHQFTTYKSASKPCAIEAVTVVSSGGVALQKGLDRGARIGAAVALARDLVNQPARDMTPRHLEAVARRVAEEQGLTVNVMDEVAIVNEGLGGLAGVAAGSEEPPRLIELVYDPPGARGTIVLVGKGITFDSGGLSLKSGEGMMTMKCDMGGAAAVIAAMSAMPAVAPKVRVIGIAACTENLPSGKAIKPGDVLKIRNGKTVEVLNTDAEGRLVLADALSLAVEAGPDAIVDLATLTGACIVALGRDIAGLMGNDDDLVGQVAAASERAGEPMWHLPLPAQYRKHIDSEIADIKNIGMAGAAGTLSAGLFLQEFVGDTPWVHLDIAGPAFRSDEDGYLAKGGTGFGVRTLLELVATYRRPSRRSA